MTIPSAIHFQGTAVLAQQDSHQPVHHVLAVELLLDIVGHHSGKTEEKAAEGKHCARARGHTSRSESLPAADRDRRTDNRLITLV